MKNNISYYRHETGSHGHWKFKTLRRKFSWAGEGRFWALNNMIAESENCWLDISNTNMVESISADIDLTIEEFITFINFLVDNVRLLKRDNNRITTGIVQETLEDVMKKRDYQKNWAKNKSSIEKGLSSIETTESNIEGEFSSIENEQRKGEERKVKERREDINAPPLKKFKQMPLPDDVPELPDIKMGSAKELIKITKGIDLKDVEVFKLFTVFKVQSLTGKKYYHDQDEVFSHFFNWIKIHDFSKNSMNGNESSKNGTAALPSNLKKLN